MGLQPQRAQPQTPSCLSSGPAPSECRQTQTAENLVSYLCAPPVQEDSSRGKAENVASYPCGPSVTNSLLTAEGDLEQRGKAAENLAPNLCGSSAPKDSLLTAEGDLEQRGSVIQAAAAVVYMQGRCLPIARPMEGGALAPPSPPGAVAIAALQPFGPPCL